MKNLSDTTKRKQWFHLLEWVFVLISSMLKNSRSSSKFCILTLPAHFLIEWTWYLERQPYFPNAVFQSLIAKLIKLLIILIENKILYFISTIFKHELKIYDTIWQRSYLYILLRNSAEDFYFLFYFLFFFKHVFNFY